MNWEVEEYTVTGKGEYSVKVFNMIDNKYYWVDVWIDEKYHDIETDWNQYIFSTTEEDDIERSQVQSDCDNFIDATGIAVCFLEKEGLIYQDKGGWFIKE